MAFFRATHLNAAAGFSGKRWDMNLGHNLSYTTPALDATFAAGTNVISLATGTIPTWMYVGKDSIKTNSLLNPGPFTIKDNTIPGQVTVQETLTAEAGVTVTFDGSNSNGIQDVLLKDLPALATSFLTADTPYLVVSTGALGGNRKLDLSKLEVEVALEGGKALEGRFLHLSIQNSDVNNTGLGKTITVNGSGLINGAATFVIDRPNDYWLEHDQNGNWIVTLMPSPQDKVAANKRVHFSAADWGAHPTNKNTIRVTQNTVPGVGEVGPHNLANYPCYLVQVWNEDYATFTELEDVEPQVDKITGDIILKKAQGAQPFNGWVIIGGTLD
jgi:hypothetical protein